VNRIAKVMNFLKCQTKSVWLILKIDNIKKKRVFNTEIRI